MYSTCLFCNRPLGSNEIVEHFPVGHRLAFDGAKGRLWVVCRKCERWNLTPLEERWEAIEECERKFRRTRLRMSTDEIGLARLKEGLELVRIGEPLRPEFAAWRYGDQFGRRRKRALITGTVVGVAVGAVIVGGVAAGVGVGGVQFLPQAISNLPTKVRIKTKDGRILKVRLQNLRKARFLVDSEDEGWAVYVKHSRGKDTFEGEEAVRVAGLLLPKLNEMAGSKKVIQDAVELLEKEGDPEAYLTKLPHEVRLAEKVNRWLFRGKSDLIYRLPKPTRLALEMALHKEQESRALAGELVELETAWREAEEIAKIADDLLVPKEVDQFIEKHKRDAEAV